MHHLMTTYLKSPVCLGRSFFQKEKNKTQKNERKKRALCVIVRDLRERGGGGGSSRYMSSSENALLSKQDDQLFPYIDLPAIILSSNGLNNRALSEAAITDKQRDNMRCPARHRRCGE